MKKLNKVPPGKIIKTQGNCIYKVLKQSILMGNTQGLNIFVIHEDAITLDDLSPHLKVEVFDSFAEARITTLHFDDNDMSLLENIMFEIAAGKLKHFDCDNAKEAARSILEKLK